MIILLIMMIRSDQTLALRPFRFLSTQKSWFFPSLVKFSSAFSCIAMHIITFDKPPGYSNFNKRMGLDTNTLGGKPRSLEFSEGEEVVNKEEKVDKKNEEVEEDEGETVVNSVVEEEKERRKREATDANGNRVLHVYRLKIKTAFF